MKKVICIVGPTGSGKTALSIELAKHFSGEIINADSVSIYEKLDIGSAKVSRDQMDGIKHHLVSHVPLDKNYTVFDFQQDVRNLLKHIEVPFIVGGSGLYIKSALYDYEFESQETIAYPSVLEMIETIKLHDHALDIDFDNIRRIESAYKTIISGKKRSLKQNKDKPLYDILLIYLDVDRLKLKNRLNDRLELMIEKGFIDETKSLIDYDLNIIGYREIKNYLLGAYSLEDAKMHIITSTMRFAKRQKTWFLNQMTPNVYDALDKELFTKVKTDIKNFLGVNKG